MKTILSKILVVLLMLSPILSVSATQYDHRIITTPFSGSEYFAGVADPNPGTFKFVDGKVIAKDFVVYFVDTESDPRVSGDVTATINYVEDEFGAGPVHGTEYISNAGGAWNARFTGHAYADGRVIINIHGLGEGAYEGLHADWDLLSLDYGNHATVTGTITEHDR